ncbi:hypothetical protein FH972_017572 [Carpinus fangiana]|uniref:Uncharacterized protein n=1 Tax=Carpinus fangiana TaxID=176857 RepID=A0A5N6RKP0_9ROSI|nr:hypothetical protein FH972_017572 [Carpinus fangiana]
MAPDTDGVWCGLNEEQWKKKKAQENRRAQFDRKAGAGVVVGITRWASKPCVCEVQSNKEEEEAERGVANVGPECGEDILGSNSLLFTKLPYNVHPH